MEQVSRSPTKQGSRTCKQQLTNRQNNPPYPVFSLKHTLEQSFLVEFLVEVDIFGQSLVDTRLVLIVLVPQPDASSLEHSKYS